MGEGVKIILKGGRLLRCEFRGLGMGEGVGGGEVRGCGWEFYEGWGK